MRFATPLSTCSPSRSAHQVEEMLSGLAASIERYIDDFTTGWKVVLVAGGVCPIVLSILFLFFFDIIVFSAYTVCSSRPTPSAAALTIYLFLKAVSSAPMKSPRT